MNDPRLFLLCCLLHEDISSRLLIIWFGNLPRIVAVRYSPARPFEWQSQISKNMRMSIVIRANTIVSI